MSPLPYTTEVYPSREAWLKGRTKGIGASEAAAILGVSKWSSPFAIWARKRGIVPDSSKTDSVAQWGLYMEAAISQWMRDETGWRIGNSETPTILRSRIWDKLCCTLDAWVHPNLAGIELGGQVVTAPFPLEYKNCDFSVASEWKKAPPLAYQVQCQVQMFVTGAPVCVLAVCIGGNEGRWFPVMRNQKFIDRMLPRLKTFWDGVERGVPPQVDGHEETRRALTSMFDPPVKGRRIELPPDLMPLVQQYDAACKALAYAETTKDTIGNQLRQVLGDAEEASLPGLEGGFTWRKNSAGKRPFLRVEKLPKIQPQEDYSAYEPATTEVR